MKSGKAQQSRRKIGVNFEDAMNQAFSDISQNLKLIEVDTKKQKEKVDLQRRRRVSAPATTLRETAEIEEWERKMSTQTCASSLLTMSSLQCFEEEPENGETRISLPVGCLDEMIGEDKKQRENVNPQRRRRVSAPVTMRETTETTTAFKQLKKEIGRKLSRPSADSLSLPTMPWLECFEEETEMDFEPVDFNLSFLDDFMKVLC